MISERHCGGPQTVDQAEKPGAPESETHTHTHKKKSKEGGAEKGGIRRNCCMGDFSEKIQSFCSAVSLPVKHESVKTELVLTSPRINREHAGAGRADAHKNSVHKQVLRY